MKEMNLIGRSKADYLKSIGPAMIPAGILSGSVPIIVAVQAKSALLFDSAAEDNPVGAVEKAGIEAKFIHCRMNILKKSIM